MDEAGVGDMPLGVDISEIPMLAALAIWVSTCGTASRPCSTPGDQVTRRDHALSTAAAMVDGVYQDIYEALKPGA
jgi:Xaa-Pro dipeptidase